MQKIKISERQILLLKNLEESKKKKKVLKINEGQYNRLFNKASNIILESTLTKIDIVEFAEEVIVFVKDVINNPKKVPFSSYWGNIGISKSKLFNMVKKEGLLTLDGGIKEYKTPKIGFRKKIKELYNKINEKGNTINELGDAGYPAGADMDPNNPWDQDDSIKPKEREAIKAQKEIMRLIYFNEEIDGTAIFERRGDLFYISLADIDEHETREYEDIEGYPDENTVFNYVNDKLQHGEIKTFSENAPKGQISLITPRVKEELIRLYGSDEELSSILNGLSETTGAASSGSFTPGGISGPIDRDTGNSPEEELRVITDESTTTTSVGGDSGTFAYDAPVGDGNDFMLAGNKENKKGNYKGVTKGRPITKGFNLEEGKKPFMISKEDYKKILRPILESALKEDALVSEGFKKGQLYKNGLARRLVLDVVVDSNPDSGSISKITNKVIRKKVVLVKQWVPKSDGGGTDVKTHKLTPKEFSNWELVSENKKKVLKLTENQIKKILESENQKSTAYPNGEMVTFDDCTKLNNNKVAQNGGCSQGAVDNVVKLNKTKSSVVSEGEFNPNIAAGSTYAIEIAKVGNNVALTQNNGQTVVIHHDDIYDVIKSLNNIYGV